MVRPFSFTHHRHVGGTERVMQNENNNTALDTAITAFADLAFALLDKLDGDAYALTPAAHGARLLLQNEGVDFAKVRSDMHAAMGRIETVLDNLAAPAPVAAPEVAAAPVAGVDAATVAALVREQVAALVKAEFAALDLRKVASEVALAAFEAADLDYEGVITNNVDLEDIARTAVNEAIDNNIDFNDLARDLLSDKIDNDLNIDFDDEARDMLTEKVDNEFDFDVDSAAQDIVKDKIDEDLDIERAVEKVIRDLLNNKPLTITLKG